MISFEVGGGDKALSVYIQERAPAAISPTFAEVMDEKIETDKHGRQVLRLPNDHPKAWEVLLYASVTSSLPALFCDAGCFEPDYMPHLTLLIHCWLLGDKYKALQFQDAISSELLWRANGTLTNPKASAIAAIHAKPGSKLWDFFVEEKTLHLNGHYGPHQRRPTVAEDLGRDDIPKSFMDDVNSADLDRMLNRGCRVKKSRSMHAIYA